MPRGTKVERNSVSDQPHEITYEAKKMDVKQADIKDGKKLDLISEKILKRK